MILRVCAAVVLAICAAAGMATSEEQKRELRFFMTLTGACTELAVEGAPIPCEGKLGHTEYDDGRIGFYFIASEPDGMIVSFSGAGHLQTAPSANARLQPVDGVILPDGVHYATGQCFFENPYAGPARVECEAEDENGALYTGKFRSDGAEPRIMDVAGTDKHE